MTTNDTEIKSLEIAGLAGDSAAHSQEPAV